MAASRIKGITVEIGGDTTKLQTALKGVNTEIKNTQAQLKDVEKLLKLDPGNTELLAQKEKLLAQAVEETKKKLESLKTAAEQANTALENGDISQEQYDALQREILETEQDLKKLEAAANESSTALQKIGATGEKLKTVGDGMQEAGRKMLPATAAVTALGTASVSTAANFESAMSQVQATMGITKDSMSTVDGQSVNTMTALNNLAKEMGKSTAFSATECAQALNYLALAGYDTEQMTKTLPTVLNLAAAGGLDLASASDMVTDAMSALGMETSDADKMVDQMAKTASSTNTSVGQLGEGILTIGATAKSIKGGTAELNTALGILANNGIKGAEGGTHLRNIILSLQNPTDKAADAMESLGVKVYDSQGNMRSMNDILGDLNTAMDGMTSAEKDNIISKIFNKTDLASVNALLANTGDTWDNLQSSIENSGGAAAQMADTQLDNLQGQLTLLKSALEGLAISFGEALMPVVKNVVGALQKLVDWLNSMDTKTRSVIIVIAAVVAAIGPVLIIVGKIISAVGTIMTVIPKLGAALKAVQGAMVAFNAVCAANPYVLIIAAIVALIAIFVVLWNKCDGFRQFWINLWEGIKSVVSTVVEAIKNFFTGIIDFVKNNWQGLLLLLVNPFAGAFKLLYDNCEGFRNFINGALEAIKTAISNAWEAIKTGVTTAWTAISNFFTTIWEGIKNIFNTVLEAIKTAITTYINAYKTVITTVFNAIKLVVTTIWTAISTFFTTILNTIKTTFTTVWDAIKTAVTTVVNAIKTVVTTVWNGIKTAITTVMNTIKTAISTAWNTIKTTVSNAANAIKTGVSNAFNAMLNSIKSIVGNIAGAVKNGFQGAISYIKSLPGQALQWGKDIINGIVNGIKSCIGAVKDAVGNVADTIKSFLHFSVPDEGPLTDYESWMPDFMAGLAKGIDKSKGMVAKAIEGVSNDMIINPKVDAASAAIGENTAASTVNTANIVNAIKSAFAGVELAGGDTVIPVYIGGTQLDEIIITAQQRANLRSGGR